MPLPWLLCSYRLPREPSRLRLAIWRRLKRVGAVVINEGIWVLPLDAKTREDFEWIAEEIEERGGSVLLWQAESLPAGQDAGIIERFRAEARERYAEALASAQALNRSATRLSRSSSLDKVIQQLHLLERSLRLDRRRDYFRAPGRGDAEQAVQAALDVVLARSRALTGSRRSHAVGH